MSEPTIYEMSSTGRKGVQFPEPSVPDYELPKGLQREELPLPEVSELGVIRHFTRLSQLNFSINTGFYPLGSCTMKYNPVINEETSRLPGFTQTHPLQPIETVQGNLMLMYLLQDMLKEIGGFDAVSLQPAAGAQGELTGVLIIREYHKANGDGHRNKILVPDSAHGTNPATSSMSGMKVVQIPSDERGNINIDKLKAECDGELAGLMLTNPNTLGLFEEQVEEVIKLVHDVGGLVYGDGANMNALLGIARPGDMGFDILHYNLHKTFTTPHGGGGPGSGPVGVIDKLADYLPSPIVDTVEEGTDELEPLYGLVTPMKSIGRIKSFHGHFGMHVRALTYILMLGADGLREVSEGAVLNANYLMSKIKKKYKLPFDRTCMHEFVVEGRWDAAKEIHALDVSKRLIDYGFHPPTNYFPLIVPEALMIEPTETESKETLDAFIDAMEKIAEEAVTSPELLKNAPHNAPMKRLDEVQAAKHLVLCCEIPEDIFSK